MSALPLDTQPAGGELALSLLNSGLTTVGCDLSFLPSPLPATLRRSVGRKSSPCRKHRGRGASSGHSPLATRHSSP
jgi:hypothetical protein